MGLSSGSRLGPYEIVAPIGAGGMGEVYRAKDTRLERTVAVKVLPAHMSSSPESRQRFEREAKTISQLSHAHICALYDVGSEGETEYLVMEYLEGQTLAERLANGALPLEQTLRYGQEIADALDKAHRQGIVHRDLKPANVMITKSGVKLLDFGLAKAVGAVTQQSGLTALPTAAGSPNLTEAGTILGTFQYMAPEQLEGKDADGRTDIFAFGAVLYEMATGRKAFSGASQASLISSIMKEEPPAISTMQAMSPPALDRLVRTCLAKDPEDRWQSARDVGAELKWIAEGSQAGIAAPVAARRKSRERLAWAIAGIAAALALWLGVGRTRQTSLPALPVRAGLALPEKLFLREIALSPDGRYVAFTGSKYGDKSSLWIRALDGTAVRAIPGADGTTFPFWSPDARSVAFFSDGKLRRVDREGGAVLTICPAEYGLGGTWNRDGTIVFAPTGASGLFRVPAAGGSPVAVTKLDTSHHVGAHRFPQFLPDGRHFLYFATGLGASPEADAIHVASLDEKEDKVVVARQASSGQYASGHLLYVRDGSALVAQRFDLSRLETQGDPKVLEPRLILLNDWVGGYPFAVSQNTLILEPAFTPSSRLGWFDRNGRTLGALGTADVFIHHALSPDGGKVAASIFNPAKGTSEIRIYDVASGAASAFVVAPSINFHAVWSPDGRRIVFCTDRNTSSGQLDLWSKALDGSSEEPFLSPGYVEATDWSRDGRTLAIMRNDSRRQVELAVIDAGNPKQQTTFASGGTRQGDARFSPDGKWVAYSGNESGTSEVYVRPFPGPGGKWKVSSGGGDSARWRGDGKELFYVANDNRIMAVPISFSPTFHAGTPVPLFAIHPAGSAFDVTADGQRFLVDNAPDDAGSPPIELLLNWMGFLKSDEQAR